MTATRADLTADLHRLGVRRGDSIMVHASVRAVGPMFGGPDQILLAIEDAVGPEGAVLMYLSVQEGLDDIGRGVLSAEEEAGLREHMPTFDPATARAARDHGVLAEFFRTWPGTIVTPHPTRFGARGDKAPALLADQPWDFALGARSPLDHLCADGGRVLLLGSDHDAVTLLHYAEHIADIPDKVITRFEVPMLRDGRRVWVPCLEVDSNQAHASWPDRFFAAIVDRFVTERAGTGEAAVGRVGASDAVLLDAMALVAFAVPIMEAMARGNRGEGGSVSVELIVMRLDRVQIPLPEWTEIVALDPDLRLRTAPDEATNPATGAVIRIAAGEGDAELRVGDSWVPFLAYRRGKLKTRYSRDFENTGNPVRTKIAAVARQLKAVIATDAGDDLLDW